MRQHARPWGREIVVRVHWPLELLKLVDPMEGIRLDEELGSKPSGV